MVAVLAYFTRLTTDISWLVVVCATGVQAHSAWGSAKRHFTSKAPERVFTWKTLFEDRAMPETTVQLAALFYGRAALRCLWPQGAEQAEQARRAHCKRMGTGTGGAGGLL